MSLFSSVNLARLALGAQQTAIQTTGQNIANANTEGYARQRVQLTPTPADDLVNFRIGTGVQVERIERIVNESLDAALRDANSDFTQLDERVRIYSRAEAIFNDLGGGGLSQALNDFFDSLEDLSNEPEDATVRAQVIEQAQTLAETLNFLDGSVRSMRQDLDDDIRSAALEINRLTTEIADLNRAITDAEFGGLQPGTANDLRNQRDAALSELSQLIDIQVIEASNGSIQVVTGRDSLVYGGTARELELSQVADGDISQTVLRFTDDGQRFAPPNGRLGELFSGRDTVALDLRGAIDEIATGFSTSFNQVHATGEGIDRFSQVLSEHRVEDRFAPLGDAGFPFPIRDGSFEIQVIEEGDDVRSTFEFEVDLDGNGGDTTLESLVADLNTQLQGQFPQLSARITTDGHFEMNSTSSEVTFTFRNDTSGLLPAIGVGTFFHGTDARSISVSSSVTENPNLIATRLDGGPGDNRVIAQLVALRDESLLGNGSQSFESFYEAFIGKIGVDGAEAIQLRGNQDSIRLSAQSRRDALSGVNLDEEAINLIQFQRAYQSAARFLDIVDGLLETLIASV